MKDYNLHLIDAAFIASGLIVQNKARLYRFRPDAKENPDDNSNDYGFDQCRNLVLPSSSEGGGDQISMAEDAWSKEQDYWLGRSVLTDIVVKVPDKGCLLINDATVSISKQKEIVKTPLVGAKGTVKEYITDGDYSVNISVGIVAVNGNNEILDQYPENGVRTVREVLEVNKALEISSVFLDLFDINNIVVTGFNAKQTTYSNRQVIEITAISDEDFNIESTDY